MLNWRAAPTHFIFSRCSRGHIHAAGNRVQETVGSTTSYYLTDDNNPTGYAEPLEVRTYTGSTPSLG